MSQAKYEVGSRVQVFYAKKRQWVPGTVKELLRTGANVMLDTGFLGFFYWASMSPVKIHEQSTDARREPPKLPPLETSFFTTQEPSEMKDINVRLVLLTPELAEELLARNDMNRPIKATNLAKVKQALLNNHWRFNGDTICLSKSGIFIDGQHRCLGVRETGRSIWVILVEGLDEDVFATKDIGARRRASDVLHILGETNCKSLAAALGFVDRYLTGKMDSTESVSTFSVEDLLEEHRDLGDSVRHCGSRNNGLAPPALLAALHYLFSKDDRDEADRFVKDLFSGAGLGEEDGVYVLRERLMKNRLSKAKLPTMQIAALAIKAWNARRRGSPVRSLRWRSEGDSSEAFPVIHGRLREAS